jgi:hypothetical protein
VGLIVNSIGIKGLAFWAIDILSSVNAENRAGRLAGLGMTH